MARPDDPVEPAPSIQLGILGPMSANVDGVDVNLGGVKQRAVLAMLVLGKGQQVTADRLDRRALARPAAAQRPGCASGLRLAPAPRPRAREPPPAAAVT